MSRKHSRKTCFLDRQLCKLDLETSEAKPNRPCLTSTSLNPNPKTSLRLGRNPLEEVDGLSEAARSAKVLAEISHHDDKQGGGGSDMLCFGFGFRVRKFIGFRGLSLNSLCLGFARALMWRAISSEMLMRAPKYCEKDLAVYDTFICIYTYTYLYICTYTYTYMCVLYIYIYIHIYIYIYTH